MYSVKICLASSQQGQSHADVATGATQSYEYVISHICRHHARLSIAPLHKRSQKRSEGIAQDKSNNSNAFLYFWGGKGVGGEDDSLIICFIQFIRYQNN